MINNLKKKFYFIKNIELLFSLYKSIFHRKNRKIEKYVFDELKRNENYNKEKIYQLQSEKLLDVLKYSYINTKYYKKTFDEIGIDFHSIDSFKKIPILTKDIIIKNKDDLISKQFTKESLVKRNTGGSTGEPLEFFSDKMSGFVDNAHHWYLYSLMGYKKGDVIIGSGGTVIPQNLRNNNIFWLKESKDSVWGEYDFSVLYITDSNIHHYIEKIFEIKPAILRGYPSFFDKLATYIIKNNITLPFTVKGVNLTAEMCSLSQRLNIEKAFSSVVYFEYGHTEVCLYCYTHDDTYIYKSSPIYGYIEVLKEDGTDANIGEVGSIIVTGFNNHGMPFIRYDTGDMGELLYRNGGAVHFKKILGRNQDYIISKDNQKRFLTALIFGQHLKAFENINQWQLLQNEVGKVFINIVKGNLYTNEDELEILSNFQNVADIDLCFKYVENIPLTKRGKHLFLIQNIGKDSEH